MILDNNMDFIDLFEKKLSNYTGFKYAIATDCCTNAILLCCEAKRHLNLLSRDKTLLIPKYTYMSVPMTLRNNGWKIQFISNKWEGKYMLGINSTIYDAATDMHENMADEYKHDIQPLVCISFQQKKRLSLGKGGAILTNNGSLYQLLKRLVYDGRNPYIADSTEITNFPNDIICGYHCYMEPDKAAKGILLLNQPNCLMPYKKHSWKEYTDISTLNIWQ